MKRWLVLLAVILGSTVFAMAREATTAFACSGPPTHWQMAMSGVIFEGRITSAREIATSGDTIYVTFDLRIRVLVAHKGVSPGDELNARARVPRPNVPVMCPQFVSGETFQGKYLVASLFSADGGQPVLDQWATPYLEDEPAGAGYQLAVRLARVAAQTDAELPYLSVTPREARCGSLVTIAGGRFAPGAAYRLNHPGWYDGEGSQPPVVTADSRGVFRLSFRLPPETCPFDGFVEALPVGAPEPESYYPVAMVRLVISEVAAPGPPDAGTGTGLAVLRSERDVPWSDVAMVIILVMAFSGGTVAILRSVRRR